MVLVAIFLLLTGIFNILDYFYTLTVTKIGFEEMNPFMAPIIDTWYFPFLKLVVIPLALLIIWLCRNKINLTRLRFYSFVLFISYFTVMIYYRLIFGTLL